MPPFKTFTPFLIPTTALLLALASCEDNNPQVGEKPGHGPNQAIDQRIETFEGRSGQAEQRTEPNKMQPQPNAMGTSTGGTGGTSTGGTSTGGTSTGGTSTSGTSGDKPPTTGTTGTTTTTTDQDP